MEIFEQLNEVFTHIEDNLTAVITADDLAKITMLSPYNFQRLFSYLVGTSLAEYIRNRRLVKAGFDLQNGDKAIDVSLRYGYESSTAFTRAFKAFHGITPSQVNHASTKLHDFPPMNFDITVEGVVKMYQQVIKDWLFTSEQAACNFRSAGILIHNGKILLQRERDGDEYAIPGGTVQLGETAKKSIIAAYLRETGVDVRVSRLVWVEEIFWEWNGKATQTLCFHFLISVDEADLTKLPNCQLENENIIFEWVSLDKLTDLIIYPEFAKDKLQNLSEHIEHFVTDQRFNKC